MDTKLKGFIKMSLIQWLVEYITSIRGHKIEIMPKKSDIIIIMIMFKLKVTNSFGSKQQDHIIDSS